MQQLKNSFTTMTWLSGILKYETSCPTYITQCVKKKGIKDNNNNSKFLLNHYTYRLTTCIHKSLRLSKHDRCITNTTWVTNKQFVKHAFWNVNIFEQVIIHLFCHWSCSLRAHIILSLVPRRDASRRHPCSRVHFPLCFHRYNLHHRHFPSGLKQLPWHIYVPLCLIFSRGVS